MNKILIILLIIFLSSTSYGQQTVGLIQHSTGSTDDGYVLFAPISSTTTYLIDKCGKLVHTWSSAYRPGQAVYLLEDGNLLRTGNAMNTVFTTGGNGGIIEKTDWSGNNVWSYSVSDSNQCQHHDVKQLPNGNILVIAWEKKTNAEAIAAGRNPAQVGNNLWSEKVLELEPVGTDSANIVWEWHVWDHLVQDFDSTKNNFSSVSAHSELLNLNYKANQQNDWLHLNSIDYNPYFDQIILSSHNFNELWVIDHSTTLAEAASHSGGASGKGGDLLYRWGNPIAHKNGTIANQKLWGQHNVQWIDSGLPYGGNILIFNNGHGLPNTSNYSSVEIITPPVNSSGIYNTSLPIGPAISTWSYVDSVPTNFYAMNISGAQQLVNGNMIICNGPNGDFFEIDSLKNTVWEYINPVSQSGILSQGSTPAQNLVFRCYFYPTDYSGFTGQILSPGQPIELNPQPYVCNLVNQLTGDFHESNFKIYPNPSNRKFIITADENIYDGSIQIFSAAGERIFMEDLRNISEREIFLENISPGIYFIQILSGNKLFTGKLLIQN